MSKNFIKGSIVAVALLFATVASAAITEQSFGFKVNGKFNDQVGAGSVVQVTSAWDVTSGDQLEYLRTRAYNTNGDIVAEDCESVGTVQDANDRSLTVSLELASDQPEGNLTIRQLPFGDPTLGRSPGCDLAFDYGTETNHAGRLFVDDDLGNDNDNAGNSGPGGNTNTGGNDTEDTISFLQSWIKEWSCVTISHGTWTNNACVMPVVTPPALPVVVAPTACATLAIKMSGAMYGVYNNQNVKLQGFLLSEGMSIPWLTKGAAFGFWGTETQGAINVFKSQNACV